MFSNKYRLVERTSKAGRTRYFIEQRMWIFPWPFWQVTSGINEYANLDQAKKDFKELLDNEIVSIKEIKV